MDTTSVATLGLKSGMPTKSERESSIQQIEKVERKPICVSFEVEKTRPYFVVIIFISSLMCVGLSFSNGHDDSEQSLSLIHI